MIPNNDNTLSLELAKRIFSNLGALPKNFGKTSLTHTDLILPNDKIKIEEDGEIYRVNIWSGKVASRIEAMLTNLRTNSNEINIFCILKIDNLLFGINYDWDEKCYFALLTDNKWIKLDIATKLNITAALEIVTQNGYLWEKTSDKDEQIYNALISLIEVEPTQEENESASP